MRSRDDIYFDLSKEERGTPRYDELIKELYELICNEADAEYALLKAYGLSEEQIFNHADSKVQEVINEFRRRKGLK